MWPLERDLLLKHQAQRPVRKSHILENSLPFFSLSKRATGASCVLTPMSSSGLARPLTRGIARSLLHIWCVLSLPASCTSSLWSAALYTSGLKQAVILQPADA